MRLRPWGENGAEEVEAKETGPAGASLAPVHLMKLGFATIDVVVVVIIYFVTVCPTFFCT